MNNEKENKSSGLHRNKQKNLRIPGGQEAEHGAGNNRAQTERPNGRIGNSSRTKSLTYFSTFSGIGGFELGIERAASRQSMGRTIGQDLLGQRNSTNAPSERNGNERHERATCVGYSEIDKYAAQIYQSHFPNHQAYGDITKINADELPDFDLLCGGFPCQSFSIAGKRGGFSDTRGTMFFELARILKAKQPRLLLLENVKGLLSHDAGRTFATIIATLDELGYDLQWQVLNSKDFGVPQNRERVFIVGHLRGTGRPEVFPFTGDGTQDGVTINRIAHMDGFRRYNQTYQTNGAIEALDIAGGGGHQPCIQEGTKIRRLTPLECERLQSFPDGWTANLSDTQRYKTLGNAVTVNVIEAIAKRLLQ